MVLLVVLFRCLHQNCQELKYEFYQYREMKIKLCDVF